MTRGVVLAAVAAVAIVVLVELAPEVTQVVETVTRAAGWAGDFWEALSAELPDLTLGQRVILFSWAALESGWGTAWAAVNAFNAFNTTAGPSGSAALARYQARGGQVAHQEDADWEYRQDGSKVRIAQNWRAFGSWRESIRDQWANWLGRSDYQQVKAAFLAEDLPAFVQALYDRRYFTLPPDQYLARLLGVLDKATKTLGVA